MYLCAGGPSATEGQKTHQPKLHLDLIVLPGDIASLGIACRGALWRPDLGASGESLHFPCTGNTHLVGVIAENSRHKIILRCLVLRAHEKRDRCTGAHRCSRIKDLAGRCSSSSRLQYYRILIVHIDVYAASKQEHYHCVVRQSTS